MGRPASELAIGPVTKYCHGQQGKVCRFRGGRRGQEASDADTYRGGCGDGRCPVDDDAGGGRAGGDIVGRHDHGNRDRANPRCPQDRNSNASIVAAVDKAHKAAIARALKEAHEYARDYAKAVGLTLGSVISVSDAQSGGVFYGPGPFFPGGIGPFGPDQYCHTVKKVQRCVVPPFDVATLTVTYSAG